MALRDVADRTDPDPWAGHVRAPDRDGFREVDELGRVTDDRRTVERSTELVWAVVTGLRLRNQV